MDPYNDPSIIPIFTPYTHSPNNNPYSTPDHRLIFADIQGTGGHGDARRCRRPSAAVAFCFGWEREEGRNSFSSHSQPEALDKLINLGSRSAILKFGRSVSRGQRTHEGVDGNGKVMQPFLSNLMKDLPQKLDVGPYSCLRCTQDMGSIANTRSKAAGDGARSGVAWIHR